MPTTNFRHFADFSDQYIFVGIDVHKKSWTITVRSLHLQVDHFTQPPSVEVLAGHLKKKFPKGIFFSAYEAGFCGTSIHEKLCAAGISNIIVNPADIPATDKQKKNKTDFHDSRSIAERLEQGSLRGICVLSREQQELRALFRLRVSKMRDVTRANNKLKSFLTYFGVDLTESWDRCAYVSIRVLKWLNNLELATEEGTLCLKEYLEDLLYRRNRLLQITKQLRSHIQKHYAKSYECLVSAPGVGPLVAAAMLSEIGDFERFKDPDQYCSFLGLMPWEHSSGENIHTKGLQPRCNSYLRPLIIEAAWAAIRTAPEFLLYYRKHVVKNSKHAIVKVARKLALVARGLVQKQQLYNPTYYSATTSKTKD